MIKSIRMSAALRVQQCGLLVVKEQVSAILQMQVNCISTTSACFAQRTRHSIENRRRKRLNLMHLYPLTKSWHNMIPCDNCGNYYKKWHMCPHCYDQTRYETQAVRAVLEENDLDLSEETVFTYRDDIESKYNDIKDKRVVHVNTIDRPVGFFSPE